MPQDGKLPSGSCQSALRLALPPRLLGSTTSQDASYSSRSYPSAMDNSLTTPTRHHRRAVRARTRFKDIPHDNDFIHAITQLIRCVDMLGKHIGSHDEALGNVCIKCFPPAIRALELWTDDLKSWFNGRGSLARSMDTNDCLLALSLKIQGLRMACGRCSIFVDAAQEAMSDLEDAADWGQMTREESKKQILIWEDKSREAVELLAKKCHAFVAECKLERKTT